MKRGKYSYANGAKRSLKVPLIIISVILLVSVLGLGSYRLVQNRAEPKKTVSQTTKDTEDNATATYSEAEGRYLFSGTIAWDRALERDSRGNFGYLFQLLDSFEPAKYDSWIADLECPVTNNVVPYETQVNSLVFNCPPEFNKEARKYFDILNLANNHTYDQGRDGFVETQKHLTNDGFQIYGSYDMGDTPNLCEVIDLPIRLKKTAGGEDTSTLPIAFCAYHAVSRMPTDSELAVIEKYAKVMPVFAFAHLGVEYTPAANSQQRELSRLLIDAGAEFVIMNHPHWVQDTDVYKNKLIVYSTGNLIYDQLSYEELRSANYDIKMTTPYSADLQKWIDFAKSCGAQKLNDDCFDAVPAGLKKPTFSYKYDMIAGDQRAPKRWLARKGDATLQADTENRTNWLRTLQQLGQTDRLN